MIYGNSTYNISGFLLTIFLRCCESKVGFIKLLKKKKKKSYRYENILNLFLVTLFVLVAYISDNHTCIFIWYVIIRGTYLYNHGILVYEVLNHFTAKYVFLNQSYKVLCFFFCCSNYHWCQFQMKRNPCYHTSILQFLIFENLF